MVDDRFIRNIGTLTVDEQLRISETKIAIAGCGLGSEVARQLARFGFNISALADPDTVEIHNLNRQSYHHEHVGKPKVDSLLEKLLHINPNLKPKLFPEGVTPSNIERFVEQGDIIIDAIDPTYLHLSLAMTREAHRQKKTVVTAIDFGFGARLFVFPADGMDIMDFMGLDRHITDEAIMNVPTEEIMAPYMKDIPEYSLRIIMALAEGKLSYYPQNMLAVAEAAVLITAACKRVALGQPIKAVPEYVHVDADYLLDPANK